MLKVITFDGDHTLWDFQSAMRRGLRHCLKELRQTAPAAAEGITIEWMAGVRDDVAAELKRTGASLNEIRLRSFTRMVELLGVPDPDLGVRLTDTYFKHRYSNIPVFPDVVPTLNVLSERFTIGLVSNGNTHPGQAGIERFFAFTVHAEDYGVEKPDARIFEVAHGLGGASPSETLHVGDSLEADVLGARNAGVWSVWLNRGGAGLVGLARPDLEIQTLTDLPRICSTWPVDA